MTGIPTRDQVPQVSGVRPLGATPSGFRISRAPGPGAGLTGKDILRILRKRVLMIAITAASVIGVTLVGTLLWAIYAPMYTAVAALEVTPPKGSELVGRTVQYGEEIMGRLMQTHASIAMSIPVLNEALKDPAVTRTEWYAKDKEGAVDRLAKEISVGPVSRTNLIQVSMTGIAVNRDQRVALAEIVNAVATAFEKFSGEKIRTDLQETISRLRLERDQLTDQRDEIRTRMERARADKNLEDQRRFIAMEVQTLKTQMIPLQMIKAQAQGRVDSFEQQVEDGSVYASGEVIQILDMDRTLARLREQELGLITQQDALIMKFGEDHPMHRTLKTQIETVQKQVEKREEMLKEKAVQLIGSSYRADLDSATQQMLALETELQEVLAADRDLQAQATTIERLIATEERLAQDVATIDRRLLDLRALVRSERQVTRTIPANEPKERSMPKWKIMGPLGVVLGLAAGLGLAFLLEFIDTSVKSPSDISRRIDLPLLGMVPHADDVEEEIDDLRLAFLTHPNSLIGEAFRQIRTCLMFSGPPAQRRSLLVTSPLPEDGRTTVAMNLAAGCAHGGRKVLVVDANFRQPAIRDLFPQCPSGGLSSALVGQAKWENLVHEVQPNLHVVPAGVLPPNPAELLGSEQMRQIIQQMSEKYDQVFFDGAPCLVVSDSLILATLVDGIVLTVRAEANTYGIVQRMRDMLDRVGAHIMGVVLNGVRATAGGYYRESYDTFYEYHAQQELPAE